MNKPCLLDWTVLDLCEASYRSPYGAYCDTIKTCDFENIWKLVVVCFNANKCDQAKHYQFLLEDYAPMMVAPIPFATTVQSILNYCKKRELPVVAEVTELGEKCLIIASCHEPWTEWFRLIFGDVDENEQDQGLAELSPIIMSRLAELRVRRKSLDE
ncbi:MAG: hypothetical protein IJI36_07820 [Kiritimatiellae bacterium]|nr:hypothetical protein [Kiritimatiellia bacterium]